MLLLSRWAYVVLLVAIGRSAANSEGEAFIELTSLSYEDVCYNTTTAEWNLHNNFTNETLRKWEEVAARYSTFKKEQIADLIHANNETLREPKLKYKRNLIEKPGDALLKNEDWKKLTHFFAETKFLQATLTYSDRNLTRQGIEKLLSRSGAAEEKESAWAGWNRQFVSLLSNYSDNLKLVNEAAVANGEENAKTYWEMLSEYPGGYSELKDKWDEIVSLHKKIVKFVQDRLSQKYKTKFESNAIPAYLLGSIEGYDWTYIAADVIPDLNLMFSLKKNLWKNNLQGRTLYKSASALGSALLNQVPQADFWEDSNFNASCPPRLVNFCTYGMMRVSTCTEASISNFLTSHKHVAKILLNQMSKNIPILTMLNRYSALEEGLAEFFAIMSVSPAWLYSMDLVNTTEDTDKVDMVSLMITAMDVLPRMAYYLAADKWRLDIIQNNTTNLRKVVSSWWQYRMEYEAVATSDKSLPSFLNDINIVNNRPYLSKALGIILGFQIYEYVMESMEVRHGTIDQHQINRNLIKMVRENGAQPWPILVRKYLEIDGISVDPLLSFFSPLEDYIEEFQDEKLDVGTLLENEVQYEKSEDKYRKLANTPTTTTTTTESFTSPPLTSTTTRRTTTMSNEQPKNTTESLQAIQADKPVNTETTTERNVKKNFEDILKEIEEQKTNEEPRPKIDTKKAVWAVTAVLVGIVLICIIAIFGKRRCTRIPKNRRYV